LAFGARQAGIPAQQRLRLHQHLPVEAIEAPHDLAGLLNHRHLVVADRNQVRAEGGDIGGLADRTLASSEPT
jgi:hypothetical protein